MRTDLDVAIIGGGPAGSATAAYLAKAGLGCAVFERETFPRPHVGESLVTSSTRVLNEIGFLDQMEGAGFPRKYGASWTTGRLGRRVHSHDFEDLLNAEVRAGVAFKEREQPGVEQDYTWHVDRGRFDQMLLEHARSLGAEVLEGTPVTDVDLSDPARPRIEYSSGGERRQASARLVVDASGRRTLLGHKLKLRVRDPVFDQYALHTWFKGFDRRAVEGPGEHGYILIHHLPIAYSWIWQIPISEDVTSIGVVTQRKNFSGSKQDREDFFWSCLESRPALAKRLREAGQLRPLKEEGDYSYAMQQLCGEGFVLVGDAGRFVDPIFSTGVSIALNSARFAARDIVAAAKRGGGFERSDFATFETTMRRGMANWYRFISIYYRLGALFATFVKDPYYRLDVLKLLQGDVYDEDAPPALVHMREALEEVEADETHPWHSYLGALTTQKPHALLETTEG